MNCGNQYEDDSEELIEGCECGSSLFVYEKGDDISEDEKELIITISLYYGEKRRDENRTRKDLSLLKD